MSEQRRLRGWDVIVSTLVMFNLAVAQPLLDLVGRNAPFLVAHDASRVQIWLMVLALALFVPVALALVPIVVARVNARAGRGVHAALFAALTAILGLRLFTEIPGVASANGWLLLVLALAAGVGAAYLFVTNERVRSFLRLGAPLPLIVIGLFAFGTPVSELLFPKSVAAVEGESQARDVPVVMLIFDEFPVASLMTREGDVDADLFPNFARLQRDSTWFRNATTVHDMTGRAVPAILDGNYPDRSDLPVYSEHPDNLFTLLGPTHRVAAFEPVTAICPVEHCGEREAEVGTLVSDLWVLANHIVLPDELSGWLPPIGDTWAGFADTPDRTAAGFGDRAPAKDLVQVFDRAAHADRFLSFIRAEPAGSLYFLHLTLPHVPWEYMPSGHVYAQDDVPGKAPGGWVTDEWLVAQGYQRHLFQAQFVDRMLGRIIDKLEDVGIYDEALMVVTADHGITIVPGQRQRDGAPDSVGSVGSIPMFVKRPLQTEGRVVDAPVETIDAIPTIVDVLDIDTDVRFDGRSLFGGLDPDRARRMPLENFEIDPDAGQAMPFVRAKYALLGSALRDLYSLAPDGLDDLVGRRVDELTVSSSAPYEVTLQGEDAYANVDVGSGTCPCMIDGRLDSAPREATSIAVAVNGVVAGVTRTSAVDNPSINKRRFYAMVAPDRFRDGSNDLTFYVIEQGPEPVLHPIGR